jgi:RimJ/RimL family protein N-acetyltransferase
MIINLQPVLENELLRLQPLQQNDFERLYAVACDPLIWEQHPSNTRYQRDVFQNYFNGAMESGGAFLAIDKLSGAVAGSSRYYEYYEEERSILIGYTFLARQFWGGQYNPAMKRLMIDYAFTFVDTIYFHIGANNKRSQIAIERIGAVKKRALPVAYHGEAVNTNFEYVLTKEKWQ